MRFAALVLPLVACTGATSTFAWSYSDVGEQGAIECHGATISSVTSRSVNASFDPVTQKLVWESQTYTPTP